jgi:hypothetical protein
MNKIDFCNLLNRNMPDEYQIFFSNSTLGTTWLLVPDINPRITIGNSSNLCATIPGDNGAVGICVDRFTAVVANRIRVSFNNSALNLPSLVCNVIIVLKCGFSHWEDGFMRSLYKENLLVSVDKTYY